jgi:hypothetical protein
MTLKLTSLNSHGMVVVSQVKLEFPFTLNLKFTKFPEGMVWLEEVLQSIKTDPLPPLMVIPENAGFNELNPT